MVLLVGSPLAAQQRPIGVELDQEELEQVQCVVLTMSEVSEAVEEEKPPLIIVNGRDYGHLRVPDEPCPEEPGLPRGAKRLQFHFIRPHAVPESYGERGRHGVITIDLPLRRPTLPPDRASERAAHHTQPARSWR